MAYQILARKHIRRNLLETPLTVRKARDLGFVVGVKRHHRNRIKIDSAFVNLVLALLLPGFARLARHNQLALTLGLGLGLARGCGSGRAPALLALGSSKAIKISNHQSKKKKKKKKKKR